MIGAVHSEENDWSFSYSQGTDVEKIFIITLSVDNKKYSTYIWIIIKIRGICRVCGYGYGSIVSVERTR